MIFVLCGPSGVGKGTIVTRLLARDPALWLSRSWTTRPRRPGESETAYVFVDRDTFEAHADGGGFLEWNEHFDHLYGTPLPVAPEGRDVLLEIDVRGAEQVKAHDPEALVVYVAAPSRQAQEARLRARGDDPDTIRRRLQRAGYEEAVGRRIADAVVVNDELERAVEEVAGILSRHRSQPARGSA